MSLNDMRVANTVCLTHLAANAYARAHHLTRGEMLSFDDRYHVIRYVAQRPDLFDALPESRMVQELDAYVGTFA